jgi:hypothetical protein
LAWGSQRGVACGEAEQQQQKKKKKKKKKKAVSWSSRAVFVVVSWSSLCLETVMGIMSDVSRRDAGDYGFLPIRIGLGWDFGIRVLIC